MSGPQKIQVWLSHALNVNSEVNINVWGSQELMHRSEKNMMQVFGQKIPI